MRPDSADRFGTGRRRPAAPTYREIVQGVRRELELAGIESAATETERLVASAVGLPAGEVALRGGEAVEPAGAVAVAEAVARRLEGLPLQYVEGTADFRRVRLVCDERALIPRPETEQLLDRVMSWRRRRAGPALCDALDIGVGSGAIALSLLDEGVASRVVGLDVSAAALDLARENVRLSGATGLELRLCQTDIWSALGRDERFDLIVSNPPYVAAAEWEGLDSVVKDHEPRGALVGGGDDGLDVVRAIVSGAAGRLREGGALFLEIGMSQGPAVLKLLEAEEGLCCARVQPDLAGRTRFASACKTSSVTGA